MLESWQEASAFKIVGTEATKPLGYDFNDKYHAILFANGQKPNRETLMPSVVAGGKHQFIQTTHNFSPSYSNWGETLSWEGLQKFANEVVMPALKVEERMFEAQVKARSGAEGAIKKDCELLGVHMIHMVSREGKMLVHTQSFYSSRVIRKEDQKIVTGDFRPLFKDMAGKNTVFQIGICLGTERVMGVKADYCEKSKQAIVEGVSNKFDRTTRKDAAKEYLKERSLPETRISMAYAMQNTRPPKLKDVNVQKFSEKWSAIKKDVGKAVKVDQPQSFWKSIYNDLIKEPMKVIKAAYVASRGTEPLKVRVQDVERFIKDVSKPSRVSAHRAAARAVRKTKCQSLNHALGVAQKAFKEARVPKVQLPRGSKVTIGKGVEVTKEQEKQLRELAFKHNWKMNVIEPKIEQKQKQ
jgi:hypothetical protein